ncbi:DUF4337 domain-containing protein [Massilia sp. CFBP9026]|uniref:DUF4337 domain-containing protein n=1 Tax=Massilia sp. CFBP9026 TaxID=3096536 RepID=UPI002A6A1E76|nr:DUF4337 domain-containing protein [Massilia sp. CFBP9026]MDY0964199.1 DUF4337 domain-containing protein [Massilia sp. CFBP9026]
MNESARPPGSRGGDGFAGRVAVLIAVLATLGTLFAFLGTSSHNDASLYKTQAAMEKTSAANAWSHYQAKSSRQNLAELAATLPGVDGVRYRDEAERYREEKDVIRKEAERWEAASGESTRRSDEALHRQRQWAAASVAQQIAISLAAVTLLARRTWLLTLTGAVAAFGITLGLFAFMHGNVTALSPIPLIGALAAALLTEGIRRAGRRMDG